MIYVTNRQKLKSTGPLAGRSPEGTLVKLKGALEPSETNPNPRKSIWEFPKIRGTVFWGPYNKDPTVSGTILGSPYRNIV